MKSGDGSWVEQCPDAVAGMPAGFVVLFRLALLAGLAFTAWKVSTGDVPGLEPARQAGTDRAVRTGERHTERHTESRLRELASLRDQGLVADEEYAARRQAIIDAA